MRHALHIIAQPVDYYASSLDVSVGVDALTEDGTKVNYPVYREVIEVPVMRQLPSMELWANMVIRRISIMCEDLLMQAVEEGSANLRVVDLED